MKLVVTADLHEYKWPEFDYIDPQLGHSRRLEDCLSVIDSLGVIATAEGAEAIVVVGDIFHRMGIVEVETYNLVYCRFVALAEKFPVILMRGNHDHADRQGKQHSLIPFASIAGVELYDNQILYAKNSILDVDIAFIPYQDNRQKLMATVRELSGPPLCFMHVGFDGAHVGSTVEYLVKEPLSPKRVGKHFGMVYSGHYHKLQFVHDNVMYIGSPLEHTRSDVTGEQKGVIVIDTQKPNDPKFVPLNLPRFLTLHGEEGWAFRNETVPGNFIDFVMEPDWTEKNADDLKEECKKLGARGVRIVPYVEPTSIVSKSNRRLVVKAGMSMTDIVKQAVRKRHGDLNRKRLEKTMLEILREAETR